MGGDSDTLKSNNPGCIRGILQNVFSTPDGVNLKSQFYIQPTSGLVIFFIYTKDVTVAIEF